MPQAVDRLNRKTARWSPRQLARRALVGCVPRSRLVENLPSTGAVYLTFDDGPHPEHTPRLLDVLADHNARATFFVLGQACERHPEVLRRVAAEGHAIGNHTYSHVNARDTTPAKFLAEITRTDEILQSVVGTGTALFRPPYGALRLRTLLRIWHAGQTVVLWNVDPKDYLSTNEAQCTQWFAQNPIEPGDIILLHDNREHTPAVAAALLRNLQSQGQRFERLSSLGKPTNTR